MKGRRVAWTALEKAEIEDFEVPELYDNGLLLEMEYSVVSAGTETAWLRGAKNTSGKFPQYPGYSGSARVIEVGKDVTDFKPGDRVLADHAGHASHAVKPADRTVKIGPDSVKSEEAAFLVIASMSLQGIRKGRIELGESAMVMGQGLLGIFATQLAAIDGALPVIAVDFSEERRALAISVGADYALSPADDEKFVESVKEITGGRGVNAIIEVTGSPAAMNQSLACASRMGRVIALGCSRNPAESVDFYRDVHFPGVSIIGAHNHVRPQHESSPGYWTTKDDLQVLVNLLGAGRLQVDGMISEKVPYEQAPEFYTRLLNTCDMPLGNLFDWTGRVAPAGI